MTIQCKHSLSASDASLTNESTARGHVFANANFAAGADGSTTTGISSAKLGVSTIATTNTLHLRIMGIQDDPENADFTAAGIGLIVRLNNHSTHQTVRLRLVLHRLLAYKETE